MKLLQVNKENIFASKTVPATRPVQPQPLTKERLTSEYAEVFESLGLLPGPLRLEIDETVPTVQLPVRRVPIAVKDKLKAELDHLVKLEVITPVDSPTEWISATVVATCDYV